MGSIWIFGDCMWWVRFARRGTLKRIVVDVMCEEMPDRRTSTVETSLRAEVDGLASVCGGYEGGDE